MEDSLCSLKTLSHNLRIWKDSSGKRIFRVPSINPQAYKLQQAHKRTSILKAEGTLVTKMRVA